MKKSSLKYRFLRKVMKLIGFKKQMTGTADEILSRFRGKGDRVVLPQITHKELDFTPKQIDGCTVMYITHKAPIKKALMNICGGGMMHYPDKGDYKLFIELALKTGRDVVIPYYPLCIDYTLDVSLEMIYDTYRQLIAEYGAGNVAVSGCSSGGNLALGLVSTINIKGEGVPMPEKLYISSPGTCLYTEEEKAKAAELDKVDIATSAQFFGTIYDILTHGKELPEYMAYSQLGFYQGLRECYLCYADMEVAYAACDSLKKRLEDAGVKVILEIGEGLYYGYPVIDIVRDAKPGHENMLRYLRAY